MHTDVCFNTTGQDHTCGNTNNIHAHIDQFCTHNYVIVLCVYDMPIDGAIITKVFVVLWIGTQTLCGVTGMELI